MTQNRAKLFFSWIIR